MIKQEGYVQVAVECGIGLAGCRIKDIVLVDREEWEAMSNDDKEEYCRDIAFERFEWSWNEVLEDE